MILVTMPNGEVHDIEDPYFDPASLDPKQFDPSPEDPIGVVVPFLDRDPKWIVIGGLGDVMEAKQAHERWPNANIFGIDPDHRALEWQRKNGWPTIPEVFDRLILSALSDRIGQATIHMASLCCPSMHPTNVAAAPPDQLQTTGTVTLDFLDEVFGPFEDCVLWLDLEGWDYTALRGAPKLLASGRVMVVNVEVRYCDPETNAAMEKLLAESGYSRVLTWFRQWWGHNEVWKCQK